MNLLGKILAGRYEIHEEIGSGGMAIVYKAKCLVLNRYVAIKVLRDDLKNDEEFVNRFNVEAQAAASLTHPNIVSIFDVGNEDDLHYIVMEYVEGRTLKEYIDEKHELNWREAVDIAMQICKGLEIAHKNSIVHRDIKPHNIMRTEDGVIKVTDFGIARANSQKTMTVEKTAIGSVHYISPEQARGGYVDHRSDIYSLGIVLYEMLTGRIPFDDENSVTVAIKQIQEKPVPPCEYNISIPIPLEQAVLRAMEKEPSARFSNAAEFYSVLYEIRNDPERAQNLEVPEDKDETRVFKTVDTQKDATIIMPKIDKKQAKSSKNEVIEKEETEIKTNKKSKKNNKNTNIDKNKERKVVIFAILASLIVIFLLLFSLASLMGITDVLFSGRNNVEVPNLVGMSYEEAVETYGESGFSIVIDNEVESDKETGEILNQAPDAKVRIKKSDEMIIRVDVSTAKNEIVLDNYLKYTDKKKVENDIKKYGLKCEFIDESSDEIPSGAIIRQIPKAGSTVEKGDLITFYVSSGPEKENKDENKTNETQTNTGSETNNNNNASATKQDNTATSNKEQGNNTGSTASSNNSNKDKKDKNTTTTTTTTTTTQTTAPVPNNTNNSGNQNQNTNTNNSNNNGNNAASEPAKTEKKSSMITIYGPKDKESAVVQVKVNGNVVHQKTLQKGTSDVVKLESSSNSVEVEILYDGVSMQKSTVQLH